MDKKEEKQMAELKSSLGLHLASEEARSPFRLAVWFGRHLLSKWFRSPKQDFFDSYMAGRALRKEAWRKKHADPLFGLPDDDYEYLESTFWIFSKAPFRPTRISTVTAQTKGPPSPEHRELFQWLEKNIDSIRSLVPDLLIAEAKPDRDIECYGEADPERAAIAFASENIFRVELLKSDPVLWKIHAHHPTEQDVYITVEGKDEVVTRAYLSM
jgi:hypothetical protein